MSSGVVRQLMKKPLVRGVIAYAIIWPSSNIFQQTMAGRKWEDYDWAQVSRFCIFGSCVVAPGLYMWIRISSRIWPRTNLKTAIKKALIEQVTYGPIANVGFFFGMSILERKTIHEAVEEVKAKFWQTYKTGVMMWPILQTINFCWISEKNRVLYVSICSFVWTSFLAYMKQLNAKKELETMKEQTIVEIKKDPVQLEVQQSTKLLTHIL